MKPTATTQSVRIFLAMKDGPLPRAIRQVLPIIGNEKSHTYVDTADEADFIIFTRVQEIEKGYEKEKFYGFLNATGEKPYTMPKNCITLDPLELLIGISNAIEMARKKKSATVIESEPSSRSGRLEPAFLDNALQILVIDDTPKHIMSARSGLAGHHLTTVNGYEDAMNILGKEKFDVVLSDLHLPMSSKTMGSKFKLGELVPYGILLMVEAARQGSKYVAVVTDLSHHDDPFSAAFDHFSRFSVKIENAKVIMMHAPMNGDAKNWKSALMRLMED